MGILLLAATSWVWFRLFHHRYKSVAMGIMATFVAVQALYQAVNVGMFYAQLAEADRQA